MAVQDALLTFCKRSQDGVGLEGLLAKGDIELRESFLVEAVALTKKSCDEQTLDVADVALQLGQVAV